MLVFISILFDGDMDCDDDVYIRLDGDTDNAHISIWGVSPWLYIAIQFDQDIQQWYNHQYLDPISYPIQF